MIVSCVKLWVTTPLNAHSQKILRKNVLKTFIRYHVVLLRELTNFRKMGKLFGSENIKKYIVMEHVPPGGHVANSN